MQDDRLLEITLCLCHGNGNGIYLPHFHIQMRFTLLHCKDEVGHQHIYVPLAAAISPLETSSNPPSP